MFLRLITAWVVLATFPLAASDASSLFKDARKAQSRGDFANAYVLYSQALALDPQNEKYRAYSLAVQRRATEDLTIAFDGEGVAGGGLQEQPDPLPPVAEEDLLEARRALPPPELEGDQGRKNLDFRGDARKLFEQVAAAYGLLVVFESDFKPAPETHFQMQQADWKEALRALEAVTGSFLIPVSGKVALVANDTMQKRTEIEPHMTVVIPFPEPLTPQEVQEGARAVQSTMDIRKVGIDNTRRLVVFRDRVSRVKPAMELFEQLTAYHGQVMVEVTILSASENSALSLGMRLPTSFPVVNFGTFMNHVPAIPAGFTHFITFGGGLSLFGIGLAGAELFANMTKSSTETITQAQLRGIDSQPLTLHVGDKYPIVTQGYYGDTSAGGQVYTPPPTIQFEDLGVVIKVTPKIHDTKEVTLDLEAELKVLAGAALNGIPVISQRKLASRVRMRYDQTAVVAGLFTDSTGRSWTGLPLPPPFRANTTTKENSQLLVTLRPYLLSVPPSEVMTPALRVGSEDRPLTPLD